MRRQSCVWLLGLVATIHAALAAQSVSPGQPTFRAETTLVELSVVVLDPAGQAVEDLSPGDFEIIENGVIRPVKLLRWVSSLATTSDEASPIPRDTRLEVISTNDGVAESPVFVVLLDDLNTSPYNSQRAVRAAQGLLKAVPPNAIVGIVSTSGADGETLNLGPLSATHFQRVESFRGQLLLSGPPANPNTPQTTPSAVGAPCGVGSAVLRSQDCADPTRATRRARVVEAIANALARAGSRRKVIFWITEDMGVSPLDAAGSREAQRAALRAALNSDVAIYPINPVELRAAAFREETDERPGDDRPDHRAGNRLQIGGESIDLATDDLAAISLDQLARQSGGQWIRHTNNLETVLAKVVAQNTGAYLLAYESDRANLPGWHPLEVRVRQPNLRVLARRGYGTEAGAGSSGDRMAQLSSSVLQRVLGGVVAQGRLPIYVQTTPLFAEGKEGAVRVSVLVDPRVTNGSDVDLVVVTLDGRGRATHQRVSRLSHSAEKDAWEVHVELPLPRGVHQVRVAAATGDGLLTGLVMDEFQVVSPGRELSLGNVEVLRGDPLRPTLRRAFFGGEPLLVRCEVAGRPVASGGFRVVALLIDDKGEVVREQVAVLQSVSRGRATASAAVDTGLVPSGEYVLVVEARLDAGGKVLRHALPLRLVPQDESFGDARGSDR